MKWEKIEELVGEIADSQRKKLLKCGRSFVPTLTAEDVLQPNDYPELEFNPHFRYEEGTLAGIQMIQTALRALSKRSGMESVDNKS